MIFGAPPRRYGVVASTQDIARDLVRAGQAPPGTVVACEFQTDGRGRRGRSWFAPHGANVCMTVVAPPVPAADAWQVALVAGLAVAEGVAEATGGRVSPRLRFPNDVLVAGAKLAGVLVETIPPPDAAAAAAAGRPVPLIGIGVNVNVAEFPPELQATATSLLRALGDGDPLEVASVERAVLNRLGACWDIWTEGGFAAILACWGPLADPNAVRMFLVNGAPVAGCRVVGLDPGGRVTVVTPAGALHSLPAAAVLLDDA